MVRFTRATTKLFLLAFLLLNGGGFAAPPSTLSNLHISPKAQIAALRGNDVTVSFKIERHPRNREYCILVQRGDFSGDESCASLDGDRDWGTQVRVYRKLGPGKYSVVVRLLQDGQIYQLVETFEIVGGEDE